SNHPLSSLPPYANGDPFTPSPSPPHIINPNSTSFSQAPPSPIETSIPTNSPKPSLKKYTTPQDQDLDTTPLSPPHPQIRKRPRKHIDSISQAQLNKAVESSTKRHHSDKSPVHPPSSPIMLDFEPEKYTKDFFLEGTGGMRHLSGYGDY
ncbi:hypothetical protein H5410_021823, partial [Solanum commersonii]